VGLNVEVGIVPSPVVRVANCVSKALSWISGARGVIASRDTADIDQGQIRIATFGTRRTGSASSTSSTTRSSDALRATSAGGTSGASSTSSAVLAVLAGSTARAFHFPDLRNLLGQHALS